MKKVVIVSVMAISLSLASPVLSEEKVKDKSGEGLYRDHCSACHPDGGNIINPQKTLHRKDREAHGIKTAADIMEKMRNPGPGMPKFDDKALPDKSAKAIAEYIVKTFK